MGDWIAIPGSIPPEITFARFDFAYDQVQATFAGLAGIEADDLEVEGVRLVDFLTALVNGDVPPDVRCAVCR